MYVGPRKLGTFPSSNSFPPCRFSSICLSCGQHSLSSMLAVGQGV